MIISFIVAVSENNAIGRDNELPWHLPNDLKFFKRTTLGKPVLMGRKTYESLGRPLPGRLNIVVSSQPNLPLAQDVVLCPDLQSGIERLKQEPVEEGFIIGGGKIFEAAMPLADRMYITRVHTIIKDAHAFFPPFNENDWHLIWQERHPTDDKHQYSYTFQRFDRKKP